jgi:WhiB family redox-sensing transcriptional regulator
MPTATSEEQPVTTIADGIVAAARWDQMPTVPCHVGDPDLWFAESPDDLERAKALCAECPIRRECLAEALQREEPWGVWGGEIIERGSVVARKRPRGRPRKVAVAA